MNQEKRKHKRMPLKLELTISDLFKQDYKMIPEINESIEVIDISKSGVGFTCKKELPIGFYFDAKIQLPTKHFLTVIKILNTREIEEGYRIGCEFVGLGDILSKSVEEYDEELQKTSK